MQIAPVKDEIVEVVARLRDRIALRRKSSTGHKVYDVARREIDRIRKRYQRKIHATWHSVHSREGIEGELAKVVEEGKAAIDRLEWESTPERDPR